MLHWGDVPATDKAVGVLSHCILVCARGLQSPAPCTLPLDANCNTSPTSHRGYPVEGSLWSPLSFGAGCEEEVHRETEDKTWLQTTMVWSFV